MTTVYFEVDGTDPVGSVTGRIYTGAAWDDQTDTVS